MNKHLRISKKGGYVILLNTLIFLSVTFVVVMALVVPLAASNQSTTAFMKSTRAFVASSSAVEESLYRLKNEMQLGASETLGLGTATATLAVSSEIDAKTITVSSVDDVYERDVELEVSTGAGVSFNYGLQAGQGGFIMSGGARVNGNVYANGDVLGSGGPIITGSAISANKSNPTADQSSTGPATPTNDIDFGGNATPQDFAQSFHVSTSSEITSIRFYIKRTTTGWMNDINMYITADNGGKPHKTKLDNTTISTSQITTAYNYITVPLDSPLSLTPGSTYWIVFDTSTTWGNYYSIAGSSNGYANGTAKVGSWSNGNGGTWSNTTPSGLDAYFDIYVGGETGKIQGINIGQSGGEAWAHEVNNSTVNGDLYCQAGSGNNKTCNTSRPDPGQQPFPVSDGNIADWKAEAEAGGTISGNVSYGGADEDSIGPVKIDGDLSIGAGSSITMEGTLYITGDLDVSGGADLTLTSSYGSDPGAIIVDGEVNLSGGGVVEGNGIGGYVLLLTTSNSSNAIRVSGGTDSVILNAQNGTIVFTGGATANQATANTINMSGGTVVNYIEGLADVNFSSGPSGSWTIDSWSEI